MDAHNNEFRGDPTSEICLSDLLLDIKKSGVFIIAFVLLVAIASLVFLLVRYPLNYESTCGVSLTFSGIDKRQYPDGSPFSKDDLISSKILAESLASLDPSPGNITDLRTYVTVQSILPPDVKEKKAEEKGYVFPANLYRIALTTKGAEIFSDQEREAILDAVIDNFRHHLQSFYQENYANSILLPVDFEGKYDSLDIITILKFNTRSLFRYLDKKMEHASWFISSKNSLSFADIKNRLYLFSLLELDPLDEQLFYSYISRDREKMLDQYKQKAIDLRMKASLDKKQSEAIDELLILAFNSNTVSSAAGMGLKTPSAASKESSTISILFNKSLELRTNAAYSEWEASVIEDRLGRLPSDIKIPSTQSLLDTNSSIRSVSTSFSTLASLANDLSSEYSILQARRSVTIYDDPSHRSRRAINVVAIFAAICGIALVTALVASIFFQYLKRLRSKSRTECS